MALGGTIAEDRLTEFTGVDVWGAEVVDIDEVKADDPWAGSEDHRRLLDEKVITNGFELLNQNDVKLIQRVVVGVRPDCAVGYTLDGFLINGDLEKRLLIDPREEIEHLGFKIRGSKNRVWMV
ncbi:hypothetical protein [Halocatena marina]|uniref:hypothetical protein n=1 Tax=Halocatena marina TaxID=2934937 RepID=UPI00200CE897|nr:hypothetical protein [Halocatena marina]